MSPDLPSGLAHVRTTDVLTHDRHPGGLLRAHQVADGVWARLVVSSGSLGFVFEDAPLEVRTVAAGESQVIPPARLHHVVFDGEVSFRIEFHREVAGDVPVVGEESGGLAP